MGSLGKRWERREKGTNERGNVETRGGKGERKKRVHSLCCKCSTVDWEIFAVKIIRILNFCVKNISPPDGFAM